VGRPYHGGTVSFRLAGLRVFSRRVVVAVVVCSVAMTTAVFAVNRSINDKVNKIARVAVSTIAGGSGGTNYLIVGSDSRAFVKTPRRPSMVRHVPTR
jgi:hypothetical protein